MYQLENIQIYIFYSKQSLHGKISYACSKFGTVFKSR